MQYGDRKKRRINVYLLTTGVRICGKIKTATVQYGIQYA